MPDNQQYQNELSYIVIGQDGTLQSTTLHHPAGALQPIRRIGREVRGYAEVIRIRPYLSAWYQRDADKKYPANPVATALFAWLGVPRQAHGRILFIGSAGRLIVSISQRDATCIARGYCAAFNSTILNIPF
jgi:hypothetical protein